MQRDLSKSEKKLARELIEKGVQQEFVKAITDMDAAITAWKNKKTDNRVTYHALYKTLHEHDKHIAWRYDGITGSRYLEVVGILLRDGLITQEDIAGFTEENQERLNRYLSL